MVETLVLHVRDPKDLIQVSLEDSASVGNEFRRDVERRTLRSTACGWSDSESSRWRWLVARPTNGGPAPDQSAYEPLFRSASEVLANYRDLLGVKTIVPEELAKINGMPKTHSAKPKTPRNQALRQMRKTVPPPKDWR